MTANSDFSIPAYLEALRRTLGKVDLASLDRGIDLVKSAWTEGRKVLVCGNGGSALTASHYINDWNKATYLATGRSFRGACLSDNVGLLTSYSNDVSYEEVYREQLKNLMDPGDLVIAVSGSGNSPNVVHAVEYANLEGGVTLAVCGYDGGKIKRLAQHAVWVPSHDMQICEDLHFIFGHMVMKALCGAKIHA